VFLCKHDVAEHLCPVWRRFVVYEYHFLKLSVSSLHLVIHSVESVEDVGWSLKWTAGQMQASWLQQVSSLWCSESSSTLVDMAAWIALSLSVCWPLLLVMSIYSKRHLNLNIDCLYYVFNNTVDSCHKPVAFDMILLLFLLCFNLRWSRYVR